MNRNQRKYLMNEIDTIYKDKLYQINMKYPSISERDEVRNYIKANKMKLKFETDKDIIDFFYDVIVNNNYKYINENVKHRRSWYCNNYNYDDIKEYEIWFDMDKIYDKIDEVEEKKEKIRKELKDKVNFIYDKIMFDEEINKFIKNKLNENNYMDKSIEEYINEFENMEI